MKIAFLLFSPGISGGSYVVYEHASRLKRKGHQVAIVTPQQVKAEEHAWHSSAGELDWLTLAQAEAESFDVVFATWWETFFLLCKLQATHYAYFVQSIESRFFPPPDPTNFRNLELTIWQHLCEKTYACVLPVITEAAWIQEYIHRNYNNWPQLVRNGIRKDIYTAEGAAIAPRQPGRLRVLVEGPVEIFFKNVPTAVRLAKEAGADEIWLLSSSAVQDYPGVDRVFSRVPIHETPPVYRSCDLVLKLSYIEGMFGPPLEMFHCGGTAVVYDVTGHDEYIVHDRNAYVVPKDDEAQVVRLLRHLKENPAELERLKRGAAETAAAWPDWDACAAQFEQALQVIVADRPVRREYLQRHTEELYSIPPPFIRARMQEDLAAREKVGQEEADRNNFISLSWDGEGKFTDEKLQWRHYRSGEWMTVTFELRIDELPLCLRIDPSVRIGIVEIESIVVRNVTKDAEIVRFASPDEFALLWLGDNIRAFLPEKNNIFFTCGPKPVILLPEISWSNAELDDKLEISIRLKEDSIQQFFANRQPNISKQEKNEIAVQLQEASIQQSVRQREEHESGRGNLFGLHWDKEGKFNRQKSQWQRYQGEEWATVSFLLPVEEVPLWLRLDPSRRVGIMELVFITVLNKTQDKGIMSFCQKDDFATLFVTSDLTWIFPERRNFFFSSGANPICILPQLKETDAAPGDLLEISIKLKESSPQCFFEQHHVGLADCSAPRWKRMLQLLRGGMR